MITRLSSSCRGTTSLRRSSIGTLALFGLLTASAASSAGCSPESAVASASGSSGSGGSSGGGQSSCRVSASFTLPTSALTTDSSLTIQRAEKDFLLTNPDNGTTPEGGSTFTRARSSHAGVLGPQTTSPDAMPQWFYGFTAVGESTAADQLIAVSRGGSDQNAGEERLAAVINESTGVAGSTHVVLNAHNAGQTIQTRLATSFDGRRAIFVALQTSGENGPWSLLEVTRDAT